MLCFLITCEFMCIIWEFMCIWLGYTTFQLNGPPSWSRGLGYGSNMSGVGAYTWLMRAQAGNMRSRTCISSSHKGDASYRAYDISYLKYKNQHDACKASRWQCKDSHMHHDVTCATWGLMLTSQGFTACNIKAHMLHVRSTVTQKTVPMFATFDFLPLYLHN